MIKDWVRVVYAVVFIVAGLACAAGSIFFAVRGVTRLISADLNGIEGVLAALGTAMIADMLIDASHRIASSEVVEGE